MWRCPVTDAIIAHVRTNLVGKHRKIGESVDALVVGALKSALLEVLGKGFNLAEYVKTHAHPVRSFSRASTGQVKPQRWQRLGHT